MGWEGKISPRICCGGPGGKVPGPETQDTDSGPRREKTIGGKRMITPTRVRQGRVAPEQLGGGPVCAGKSNGADERFGPANRFFNRSRNRRIWKPPPRMGEG